MHNNDFADNYFGSYHLVSFSKCSMYAGNEWALSMSVRFYIFSSN